MASSDVGSDSSSESGASEIANYELEVEGSPNVSDQDHETSDEGEEAYADEPLADNEWLARYEEERRVEEEQERELQQRLNKTKEVRAW